MGTYAPELCHITDMPTKNYLSKRDLTEYLLQLDDDYTVLLTFPWDHTNSKFVEDNKHILHGLLLNKKFPMEYLKDGGAVLTNDSLENIINQADVPKTPDDKINELILYLHSLQEYEGATINWPEKDPERIAKKLYFKHYKELLFYLFTLYNSGLIDGSDITSKMGKDLSFISLTFQGLQHVVQLGEAGRSSNRCFIAMSFAENRLELRGTLKKAVESTGFVPVLIDEQHIDSDVTINDAMIAEIRKARFVIADFQDHKHGVYFEAGFALGLGRRVIYTCSADDFDGTHFDTNHYPHIIYESLQELEENLKIKIEAWVVE